MKKRPIPTKVTVDEPEPVTPVGEQSPYADYFPMAQRYLDGKTDWMGYKAEVREKGGPMYNREILERIIADYKAGNP